MVGAMSAETHLPRPPIPPRPSRRTVSTISPPESLSSCVATLQEHPFLPTAKMMLSGVFETIPLDSSSDEDADSDWVTVLDPTTPSSTGDEAPRRESTDADSDEDENARSQGELVPRTKPGGYDSRVEQMLYENPELPILITDAGKSTESGRYIVYTIKTGVWLEVLLVALKSKQTLTDLSLGAYSAPPLLRVRIPTRCAYKATPNPYHTPDPRKAHHGRLRCQPHQRKARPTDHRPPKAHVGRLLEPVPEDGAGPNRWCLVEVPGPEFQLGKLSTQSRRRVLRTNLGL